MILNNNFNQFVGFCSYWHTGFQSPSNTTNWYSPVDSMSISDGGWLSHNCQQPFQNNTSDAKPGFYPFPHPKEGDGYAQLTLKNAGRWRVFISQLLLDTLAQGEEYYLEFYTRPFMWSKYVTHNIGIYLSEDSLDYFAYKTNITPHLEAPQVITDTTKWTRVSSSFIAQGNERFINIGNFRSDSASTMIPSNFYINPWFNYEIPTYLVDAISLYKVSDTLYTITLPQDTLLCPGETLDLVAVLDSGFKLQDPITTYLWNTGSTDSNITVSQPDTYWVQSTINKRFVQTDTIVVTYFDANYTLGLPDSIGFCENEEANLLANLIPQTQYYWSNGDTTRGIRIGYSTTLQLTAVTPCYTLQESVKVYQKQCEVYIYIPNAFTPNGDGNNDFFAFYSVPEPVSLMVFDRWGGIVYQNQDYKNEWDGTSLKGDTLPAGVYTYVIEYKYINPNATVADPEGSTQQIRGTVTLVR